MKLLFATSNKFKYELMKERLKDLDIELITPKMLGIKIDVKEDGKNVEENSIKKAKAYYKETKIPTIAEDAGLYIDKFKEKDQPGLYVRRVNGKEDLSDKEILDYYIDKLIRYGGRSLAHYYTGVCIIDEEGKVHSDTLDETEFLLTSTKCNKKSKTGGILEPISFDLEANKYFDERTKEEEKNHYKELDNRYKELVKKTLNKN